MSFERRRACILLLMLVMSTSSCVRIEIGDHQVSLTLGRQLVDLESAFKGGAPSPIEYTRARDTSLARYALPRL